MMIDIDKLTEAQVRYILKELLEMDGNNLLEGDILWVKGNSDYPQNNEESKMVKKIKVVNKGTSSLDNAVLRDTTIGNEYLVTFIKQGTACPDGIIAEQDSLSFKDDVDDWVSIFVADETYEVVV